MNPRRRSLTAFFVATAVTGGVATQHQSAILLVGIFGIYAVATALTLRYPTLLWNRDQDGGMASGVLAGGITFGVLTLAQGVGPEVHLGAGVLGLGLVVFGVSTGVWMVERSEIDGQSVDTNSAESEPSISVDSN